MKGKKHIFICNSETLTDTCEVESRHFRVETFAKCENATLSVQHVTKFWGRLPSVYMYELESKTVARGLILVDVCAGHRSLLASSEEEVEVTMSLILFFEFSV